MSAQSLSDTNGDGIITFAEAMEVCIAYPYSIVKTHVLVVFIMKRFAILSVQLSDSYILV